MDCDISPMLAGAGPTSSLFERGMALHASGELASAIAAFTEALQSQPGHVESTVALAHCLLDARRESEAMALLVDAVARHPEDGRILVVKGRALLAAGEIKAALSTLALVVTVEPGNAAAHTGFANALAAQGEAERAMLHSMVAFHLVSDHAHASNFAALLIANGHFAEARIVAEYALRLQPDHFGALVNWATALDGLGRLQEAATAARRAVAASPGHVTGRLMLAGLLLRLGQMTPEAWDLYEWRFEQMAIKPAWMQGRRWAGEDIAGQTILLHAEQGFGDTLQFVRYAPLVAARAGRVILAVQPPLLRLLRRVPGVDEVVVFDAALPHFDLACPLLSLPRLFGATLATIPPPLPYFDALPIAEDAPDLLRVGLVWAGNPAFPLNRERSVPVAALGVLAGLPRVRFFALQLDAGELPAELDGIDAMAGVTDFADTAARIAPLDLVIAVDTAVAHLAATMGKPVWLLSRFRGCWRWLHDRADSPWYPTMRIMRQTRPGDWGDVLAEIRRDLAAIVGEGSPVSTGCPSVAGSEAKPLPQA